MNNALMSRVALSPYLNTQSLNVYRSNGSFVAGRWTEVPNSPPYFTVQGVAYPSSQKEILQLPEGDRVLGAITFVTVEEILTTRVSQDPGISDKVEWNGEMYKVGAVNPWKDYGSYISICTRLADN